MQETTQTSICINEDSIEKRQLQCDMPKCESQLLIKFHMFVVVRIEGKQMGGKQMMLRIVLCFGPFGRMKEKRK